ncbi:MAG: chloride channel protein [Pseudomonadota bacterium]
MARRHRILRLPRHATKLVGFWAVALAVGIAAGYAALGFRLGIAFLQQTFYGADDRMLASRLSSLNDALVIGIPILGGLAVGLLMWRFTKDGRVRSVAHVIEGAALYDGRVEKRAGLVSALASLITLSTGGSTGREGPVVHLAAVISSWMANRIRADGLTGRDLLGCAVAAAVSASFNAPIAGAIFAHEVVLRHFAIHALAPITIAAVAGTVISRLHLGDAPEFNLPVHDLAFYVELPAFLLLGLICGLVAVAFIKGIFLAEDAGDRVQRRLRLPGWARPALTGGMLGLLATQFPHIIGVGYETTYRALSGDLLLGTAVLFALIKGIAVAITLAGRMGGGVFSPALMLGALTGFAFGSIATGVAPGVSGAVTLYALAGTGAVAAAVLGAPISTTLIIFELTGDWQTGIAVMLSVSTATAISSRVVEGSFFLAQLERARKHLLTGPADYLPSTLPVRPLMRPISSEAEAATLRALIGRGQHLGETATLAVALPMFRAGAQPVLPVTRAAAKGPEPVGALHESDALRCYSRALAAAAREEHS